MKTICVMNATTIQRTDIVDESAFQREPLDDLTPTALPAQEDSIPAEMVETLLEEVSGQEIHPVWLPGTPEKSGPVAARFTIPGDNFTVVRLCWYNATAGIYTFSRDGAAIDAACTGWWPVPEDTNP